LYRVRDGKMICMKTFVDAEEALEAAGLAE
jgi:hypothetical protein